MGPKVYVSDKEKQVDFAIGLIAWFVVNTLLWMILVTTNNQSNSFGLGGIFAVLCLPALMNMVGLAISVVIRRWIAFGALFAFALNLFISLLMGVIGDGMCFYLTLPFQVTVPFFIYLVFPVLTSGMFGLVLFNGMQHRDGINLTERGAGS